MRALLLDMLILMILLLVVRREGGRQQVSQGNVVVHQLCATIASIRLHTNIWCYHHHTEHEYQHQVSSSLTIQQSATDITSPVHLTYIVGFHKVQKETVKFSCNESFIRGKTCSNDFYFYLGLYPWFLKAEINVFY